MEIRKKIFLIISLIFSFSIISGVKAATMVPLEPKSGTIKLIPISESIIIMEKGLTKEIVAKVVDLSGNAVPNQKVLINITKAGKKISSTELISDDQGLIKYKIVGWLPGIYQISSSLVSGNTIFFQISVFAIYQIIILFLILTGAAFLLFWFFVLSKKRHRFLDLDGQPIANLKIKIENIKSKTETLIASDKSGYFFFDFKSNWHSIEIPKINIVRVVPQSEFSKIKSGGCNLLAKRWRGYLFYVRKMK